MLYVNWSLVGIAMAKIIIFFENDIIKDDVEKKYRCNHAAKVVQRCAKIPALENVKWLIGVKKRKPYSKIGGLGQPAKTE